MVWKWAVFLLGTLAIAFISRGALRSRRAHGFYRFFAWEGILALLLLNLDCWFCRPLAWNQLISWSLLILSLYLVIHSLTVLRGQGGYDQQRGEPGLLELEKTARLVTSGAYRLIRHPMYASLLGLAWGAFFKAPGWIGLILAAAVSVLLDLTARAEEAENRLTFGDDYQAYMRRTRRFIPRIY